MALLVKQPKAFQIAVNRCRQTIVHP